MVDRHIQIKLYLSFSKYTLQTMKDRVDDGADPNIRVAIFEKKIFVYKVKITSITSLQKCLFPNFIVFHGIESKELVLF